MVNIPDRLFIYVLLYKILHITVIILIVFINLASPAPYDT